MKDLSTTKRAIYQRERRQHRKTQNLCFNCPNRTNGTIRCEACTQKRAKFDKEYIKRRISSGMCPYCPNQLTSDLARCDECHKKHLNCDKTRAERVRSNGGIQQWTMVRRNDRKDVISHYGGQCAVCQENRLPFLTIDHIDNDGAAQNLMTGGVSGKQLATWLRQHNFPLGYQVLCWNHNYIKYLNVLRSKPLSTSPSIVARRTWARKLKIRVIVAYGGKCACCGLTDIDLLTIDHINNNGNVERKGLSPEQVRIKLIRTKDPTCRVLCFNCNSGRAINGGVCPHLLSDHLANDNNVLSATA